MFSIVWVLLGLVSCGSPSEPSGSGTTSTFDSTLAKQLGADKFGMKTYTLCFLNPGPPTLIAIDELQQINQEHFKLISQMSEQGYVVLAGTFPKPKQHAEMLVFTVDEQKVRELMADDPKIQRGLLTMDFTPWYSSAALPELAKVHQRIDANAHTSRTNE
ncbi:hypothetical protein GC194_00105 [bacterium]|nr:hypothetical protein [bacterium]